MDIFVESQLLDQVRAGGTSKFLLLFDNYFDAVYKYVVRRVVDHKQAGEIARLVFLDALGQITAIPSDVTFEVWMYSLAKERVWTYLNANGFPIQSEILIDIHSIAAEARETVQAMAIKAQGLMAKLSLEEREILKLKFFEQVSDGDVMVVLNSDDTNIGPKIYRVLKRAYFYLFGERSETQGVYFGELGGFFEQLKKWENIQITETAKTTIRSEVENRVLQKDFAVDVESVSTTSSMAKPFAEKRPFESDMPVGSDDPAKIFVNAVKEMRQEEAEKTARKREEFEKRELFFDFFDRWKNTFILVPVLLLLVVGGYVFFRLINFGGEEVALYQAENCEILISFQGKFSDAEKSTINEHINNRICGVFEVEKLLLNRLESGEVAVYVDLPNWLMEYGFRQKKIKDWRIYHYARTSYSDKESGEV